MNTLPASALLLAVLSPAAAVRADESVPAHIQSNVVKLIGHMAVGPAEGTGFAIGDGLIVTNRHVVYGAVRAQVVLNDHQRFDVSEVVAVDRYWDLAVLRIDDPPKDLTGLPLATELPPVDADVVAYVPLRFSDDYDGDEDEPRPIDIRRGVVSTLRTTDPRGVLIRTNVDFDEGNSGSPIFDEDARVVGVMTIMTYGPNEEPYAYAVPAGRLAELLARAEGAPPFADSLFHWQRRTVNDPEWMIEATSAISADPRPNRRRFAQDMLKGLIDRYGDDDPPTLPRAAFHSYAHDFMAAASGLNETESDEDDPSDEYATTIRDAVIAYQAAIDAPALNCFDDFVLSVSYYHGALCSFQSDDPDLATELVEQFIEREPTDADGVWLRGLIAADQERLDDAERDLATLIDWLGEDAELVGDLRKVIDLFKMAELPEDDGT